MSYKILQNIFFIIGLFLSIICSSFYISSAEATAATEQLKTGIKAIKTQNIAKAIAIQQHLPKESTEAKMLLWAIAIAEPSNTPSQLIKAAIDKFKDWPSPHKMQINFEKALYKESLPRPPSLKLKLNNIEAEYITSIFTAKSPVTAEGMALLCASAINKSKTATIHKKLLSWWYSTPLSPKEQSLIILNAGNLLSSIDHLKRLQMLLLTKHFASAIELAPLAYAVPITKAFIAAERNEKNALKLLHKLAPKWQTGPLYQYAYINYLRNSKRYQLAATRLNHLAKADAWLVSPNSWWRLEMQLSRELLDAGFPKLAYTLIKNINTKNKRYAAEQAFRAGWLALRFLQKPRSAIKHFANIIKYEQTTPYKAKAYYWIGRCYQQLAQLSQAQNYYKIAAKASTNYYGQLSAATLQQHKLNLSIPKTAPATGKPYMELQILTSFHEIDADDYARIWAINLAYILKTRKELLLLIRQMCNYKDYYAAVKIAKIAAARGADIGALTHLIGAIPKEAKLTGSKLALAYAVARQESEFNAQAVSKAGAVGLLQLLPQTAKEIARGTKQKFSRKKLTDPTYNTKLGINFLQQQLSTFTGSYILALVAYNAGPHRAREWIDRYGDPRKMQLYNTIDWVERIPYVETHNYVKKVLENYEIYKMLLIGRVNFIEDLKGQSTPALNF